MCESFRERGEGGRGGTWRDINGRGERFGEPTGVKTEGHTPRIHPLLPGPKKSSV